MQRFMDRLTSFLERRRRLMLGVWVALLLVSLPFAIKQTEHLTAGGFSNFRFGGRASSGRSSIVPLSHACQSGGTRLPSLGPL